MRNFKKFIASKYNRYVIKKGREVYFLTLVIFLLTVIFWRLLVIWIENGRPLLKYFFILDYHIHHFYFGVFLLIISNLLFLSHRDIGHERNFKVLVSVIFGIGLASVTDEIGLLLTMEFNLGGNYWATQSYYFIFFGAAFLLLLFFLKGNHHIAKLSKKVKSKKFHSEQAN